MDLATVDELLTTTRSVRKRLDLNRPVGREVILECIRLAMQAPTASNTQDWRWLVITDSDKRAAIAEIYRSVGAEYLAYAAKDTSDPQTQRVYASALSLTDTLGKVPVHVIPCLANRIDNFQPVDRRVGLGVDHPGRLELHARPAVPGAGIGVDDDASGQGTRGGRVARHPGHGHAGRAVPGGLHDRHRLPAGRAAAGGNRDVLG